MFWVVISPYGLPRRCFISSVEPHGCGESALGHDCMDAGGRANQETEPRSPYARAVEIKQRLGNPLGQDIWGCLFLG